MKKREKKIVITFHTTTDAMAMERYCKKRKEPISAGCGLAWCVLPQEREHLLKVMEEGDITPQAVHECML